MLPSLTLGGLGGMACFRGSDYVHATDAGVEALGDFIDYE